MPGIQTPDRPLPVSRHRWTVADFHRMAEIGLLDPSDRVELIEGELIDMSASESLSPLGVPEVVVRVSDVRG